MFAGKKRHLPHILCALLTAGMLAVFIPPALAAGVAPGKAAAKQAEAGAAKATASTAGTEAVTPEPMVMCAPSICSSDAPENPVGSGTDSDGAGSPDGSSPASSECSSHGGVQSPSMSAKDSSPESMVPANASLPGTSPRISPSMNATYSAGSVGTCSAVPKDVAETTVPSMMWVLPEKSMSRWTCTRWPNDVSMASITTPPWARCCSW